MSVIYDIKRINKARRRHGAEPLPVPKRGRPPLGIEPSKADVRRLYIKDDLSLRETAAALGCTKEAVLRALAAYGLPVRVQAKRSRLRAYSPEAIDSAVKGGMKQAAATLGVSLRTLQYYRAGLRKRASKGQKGQK